MPRLPLAPLRGLSILLVSLFLTTGHTLADEVNLKRGELTLNGNLTLAAGKRLEEGVILMTHGTLAHGRMEIMAALQRLFAEQGYSSLAINLSLGQDNRHGMFDCNALHRHRHTDALDEIGDWVEWLKQQGVEKITLLGHSRGGNQTAWFAAERLDDAIDKVVLIAPATWSESYAASDYKKRYGKSLKPLYAKAWSAVVAGNGDKVFSPVDFIYCKETSATADAIVSYYSTDPRRDTPTLLPKIDRPVLVIAGSEDKVVKGLIEKVTPLSGSETVRLEVIDGAGHMFRDLYGEDLVDLAVTFLEE